MILNVEVTADDIAQGEPKSCYRCPAALAISRVIHAEFPGRTWRVSVGNTQAMADTEDGIEPRLMYQITGADLSPFVNKVDDGRRKAKPTTLALNFTPWPNDPGA